MQRSELLDTVEFLDTVELTVLDRDELVDVVAATARVRSWLDALELRCTRQGRSLADTGHAEPAPSLIANHSGRSARDADKITRRDRVAEAMPTFEHSLSAGTVTAGHLDAIANATRHAALEVRAAFALHGDELLTFAAADTIDTFTRRCRSLVTQLTTEHSGNDATELDRQRAASSIRTWVDNTDGLHHTHAALDPLRHEIFWTAINRSIRRRQQLDGNARTPWNQIQVDALIDTVTGCSPRHDTVASRNTQADDSTSGEGGNATTGPATTGRATAGRVTAGFDRAAHSHPPSPAADIAGDLVAAIDRATGDADDHRDSETDGIDRIDGERPPDDLPNEATDDELRRTEQRVPEVSVLTDLATITTGLHAHSICETEDGNPLPVSTLRRLCCDAEIVPIVLGGAGIPLDLGRSARTVSPAQRRALRAMHRTCINPDCNVPFSHTKIHHIRFWVRDTGPTDIENLVPLCDPCHHLVHEGGWTLTMTPERIATWIRPDGAIHHQGPCIDRHPPATGPPEATPGPP